MKRFRYFFLTVLLLAGLCVTAHAAEYTWRSPDDTYSLYLTENDDGTLTVTSYGMYQADAVLPGITVPAEVEGKEVTAIGEYAFSRANDFSGTLTLPEGLLSIGEGAFQSCEYLTGQLVLPSTLTDIGAQAFASCKGFAGDLVIPGGVQEIKAETFSHFGNDAGAIVISDGVESIGYRAFAQASFCGALTMSQTVKSIGEQAFYLCNGLISDLILPASLETMGKEAFDCNGFTGTLTIPGSLKKIPERAFGSTGFSALVLQKGIEAIEDSAFSYCESLAGNLVIPDSVTTVGTKAFYNCTGFAGTLTLSEKLESLGDMAFYGCAGFIGDLTVAAKQIGEQAFYGCSGFDGNLTLTKAEVVREKAFYGCSNLSGNISLAEGLTSIGSSAFAGCKKLTGDLILPEGLLTVGDSAFANCYSLNGDLKLASTITSVGDSAFYGCRNLAGGLSFSAGLTKIGESAFYNCGSLNGTLSFADSVPEGCTIGDYAFQGCSALTSVEGTGVRLPTGMVSIGEYAFYECSSLSGDLYLPDTITTIGQQAFYRCGSLTGSLHLPSALTAIEDETFNGCALTGQLVLPENLTTIGTNAFWGCRFSGDLIIPNSVTQIGNSAFSGVFTSIENPGTLTLSESLTTISGYVFYNCTGFQGTLVIPDSVTEIEDYAFRNCTGFDELELSEKLASIGEYTFAECTGFTGDLDFPDSVTTIGYAAFYKCKEFDGQLNLPPDLTVLESMVFENTGFTGDLIIPEGVTNISYSAFYNCSGFTGDLIIPEGVTVINDRAFYGCSGLDGKLELPKTLTYIGNFAFFGCAGLKGELDFPDGLTYIGEYGFYECIGLAGGLVLPDTVTYLGSYAFYGCTGLNGKLHLSTSLTAIESYTFYQCTGFTGDLIIPTSVTSLGSYAFYECTGLDGILCIPYGITSTNQTHVFYGCKNLRTLYFPTDLPYMDSGFQKLGSITDVYYGGTESEWTARKDKSGISALATVHYESYDGKGIIISGGHNQNYPVGQTFTLKATWYSSEPVSNPTFTWTASSSVLYQLEESTCKVASSGYSASLTATFTALSDGMGIISVSGPNGLTDSVNVTVTDLKNLTFLPAAKQKTDDANAVAVGENIDVTFRYTTSGSATDEWEQIQWTVKAAEEESDETLSEVTIGEVSTSNMGTNSVELTATVTGVAAGAPVDIILTGPGDAAAFVRVVVPADKIIFLDKNGDVPAEDEIVRFKTKVGEPFEVRIRYESAADEDTVTERLEYMAFSSTTEDFFVDPADLEWDAWVELRGSLDAYPIQELTYRKTEECVYEATYTFMPAREGVTALKASNEEYAEDLCVVYATFDVAAYRTYLYHTTDEEESLTADGVHKMLEGETPATIILKEMEKTGLPVGAALWDSVQALFETSQDPSNLYDLVIREKDIYYALLLEVLQTAMEDSVDINARTFTQFGDDLIDGISDVYKAFYEADLEEIDDLNGLISDEQKKEMLEELTIESFGEKYKGLETASSVINMFDIMAIGVDTVSDFESRLSSAAMLAGMTESMESVLKQMLAECDHYENTEALKAAIQDCLDMVGKTKAELLLDVSQGTLVVTGGAAAQKLLEKVWEGMMDRVKITHPAVAAIYTAYYGGTTVSNALFSTDATLEEYYKMTALQDIKTIARAAHDTLSTNYVAAQDTASAENYLNAIDLLFCIHLQDCDLALDYVDVLDNSVWNVIQEAFGDDTTDSAATAIQNFRNTIKTQHEVSQVMWIDYVGYTYPGTQIGNVYQEAYDVALDITRKVTYACPVSVYVEDSSSNVVAYVTDNGVSTTVEDVLVMLDGDEKTIAFLNGASYTIRVVGTGTGTMNITDIRYEDGESVRTLEYNELPVTEGGEYTSKRFNHLQNSEKKTISAHSDSKDEAAYALNILSGRAEGLVDGKARAGQNIAIYAVVPEGYTFEGWVCDNAEAIIGDAASPVTTIRMPEGDVAVTARLKVTDENVSNDHLTLTDEEGYILQDIPDDIFTLRVACDSPCLLAVYDANGKMLSVQTTANVDGPVTAQLDNTKGEIARITLFRVDSLQNPVPAGKVLELTHSGF